jgi:hypothetical protein
MATNQMKEFAGEQRGAVILSAAIRSLLLPAWAKSQRRPSSTYKGSFGLRSHRHCFNSLPPWFAAMFPS